MTEIPITNEIEAFIHCKRCVDELSGSGINFSPRDYARLEIGQTELGFQVWCVRHECNVMHIDYEGVIHPANLDRIGPEPLKVVE